MNTPNIRRVGLSTTLFVLLLMNAIPANAQFEELDERLTLPRYRIAFDKGEWEGPAETRLVDFAPNGLTGAGT